MASARSLLKRFAPDRFYQAVKADTQRWRVSCSCGHSQDLWSYGGIRYKARGTKHFRGRCRSCGKITRMKLHRPD